MALYFAFEKPEKPSSGKRAIWALGGTNKKNKEIEAAHTGDGRPPILEIVRPHQDENARLVSQSGLTWEIAKAVELKKKIVAVKIESTNTSPAGLLNVGAKWAMSFTFDSIKEAIDSV